MNTGGVAGTWGPKLCGLVVAVWLSSAVVGFEAALTVLTVLGLCLALYGFESPEMGMFGVGLVITLDSVSRSLLLTGGLLRFNTFNYILLLATIIYVPSLLRATNMSTKLLQMFVVLLAGQLLISPNTEMGIQQMLNVMAGLGILVYLQRAGVNAELWSWVAVVNGTAAALGGLCYYLSDSVAEVNPNAWALLPMTGLFSACLAFRLTQSQRMQLVLLSLAAVNMLWVVLSGSRGAMLVALVQLAYLLMSLRSGAWRLVYVSSCVLAVASLSLFFPNLMKYASHRVEMLFDDNRTMTNRTSGRSDIASAGWELFLEHPLGVGTGGFSISFSQLKRDGAFASHEKQAHSGWIKILAENGIFGILLLACYVLSFAFKGWQERAAGRWPIGLLTTLSFGMTLLSVEFQSKGLWLLTAGATVLLEHRQRRLFAVPIPIRRNAQLYQESRSGT